MSPAAKTEFHRRYFDYHLRHYYSLSREDYWRLHARQNGVCGICQRGDKRLVVDHDHHGKDDRIATRGLLCGKCNSRLGWLEAYLRRDEWSQNAETYLAAKPVLGRAKKVKAVVEGPGEDVGELPLAAARRRLQFLPAKAPIYPSCRHGHVLSEDNIYTSPQGRRVCRECRKNHQAAYQLRHPRDESSPPAPAVNNTSAPMSRARVPVPRRRESALQLGVNNLGP